MIRKNDPNLYITKDEGNGALISIYVDDLIIMGNSSKFIEEIKIQLSQVFKMRILVNCITVSVMKFGGNLARH